MDKLSAIIKSVCIISAAICIVDGLASGTRFKNQMKMLLNLIFALVISAPILQGALNLELPDISQYESPDYSEADLIYREQIQKQTAENVSEVLKEQINAAGINCDKIEIDVNISETNSISISSVTISADNFEAAAEVIKNSLGAETEVYNGNT